MRAGIALGVLGLLLGVAQAEPPRFDRNGVKAEGENVDPAQFRTIPDWLAHAKAARSEFRKLDLACVLSGLADRPERLIDGGDFRKDVTSYFMDGLRSDNRDVRIVSLGGLANLDANGNAELIARVLREDPNMEVAAMEALAKAKESQVAIDAIASVIVDKSSRMQQKAIHILRDMRTPAAKVALLKARSDQRAQRSFGHIDAALDDIDGN